MIYIHDQRKRSERGNKMLSTKFGIEIEFTGITRRKAAEIIAEHFTSRVEEIGTYYDAKEVEQADGRRWKVMSDGSINCQRKKTE